MRRSGPRSRAAGSAGEVAAIAGVGERHVGRGPGAVPPKVDARQDHAGDPLARRAEQDAQAKALGEWLRARVVEVPESVFS